jgi:hypothetical protein
MAKHNNLLMVIGVALVVAVVASVATAALTGNSIKVNQNRYGNYKVYTTSEIDEKLNFLNSNVNELAEFVEDRVMEDIENLQHESVTNDRVLDMLNGCNTFSVASPSENREVKGNEICTERNAGKCIFTINHNSPSTRATDIVGCDYGPYKSTEVVAYCCSP